MERRRFGMRPGLDVMRAVLAGLGNPQDALKVIHVAGTNGKGAVCAMLDAILRAAGYRVARYTSPHLVSINERFFLDGAPASDAALEAVADRVLDVVERLERTQGFEVTFFETLTAMAFVLFAEAKPDLVVLETGLGGRLDATNAVAARNVLLSVITRIGLDHCEWLGTTHAAIAEEKAGIVKPGRPVVCGVMPEAAKEAVERTASLNGCLFVAADEHVTADHLDPMTLTSALRNLPPITCGLYGAFQVENAMTALTAIDVLVKDCGLDVPDHAIVAGFTHVVWPGRCQRLVRDGVAVYVDGAHNPDGVEKLCQTMDSLLKDRRIITVMGMFRDKDYAKCIPEIARRSHVFIATTPPSHRALPARETAALASGKAPLVCIAQRPQMALISALRFAGPDDVVLCCGSLSFLGRCKETMQYLIQDNAKYNII